MKLQYVRLAEKGMQTAVGRLRQDLSHEHYEMTFVSNIRSIKIAHSDWNAPVWVPLERVANYSPLPSETIGYK